MSRLVGAERILKAAEVWRKRCLEAPGSLFEERPLWTRENFEELHKLYVENPYEGKPSYIEKLEEQLKPGSRDAKCLMAEMTWVVYLIDGHTRADTKRERITTVWKWSERGFPDRHDLLKPEVLGAGVVHVAHRQIWREYKFLVAAMLDWTMLPDNEREKLLGRPWDFASWLDGTEFAEGSTLRHALLYLLFPDEFEPIISGADKKKIIRLGDSSAGDDDKPWVAVDKAILDIRRILEATSDNRELHFHHRPYVEFWDDDKADSWFRDQFGDRNWWLMNMNVDRERMWPGVVEDGVASIGWDDFGDLRRSESETKKELVDRGFGKDPVNRVRFLWDFANAMEVGDLVIATRSGGSYLLGWGQVTGEYQYDPEASRFRVHTRSVEWHPCKQEIPLQSHGGVGWAVKRLTGFTGNRRWVRYYLWLIDSQRERVLPPTYTSAEACADLFIPRRDFERFLHLMKTRRNLILQGPPGTGKTFMARRIAWCLIERKDSAPIEMVQFHQSYAYEDFVQGYRPTESGGFKLRDGVFHRFCERARRDPKTPHVFIIDEINRGNLSRIFGELLMLIEADKRSKEYAVSLTYANPSGERFHIPDNVYILGMMNTADRSLAMVDYALRRRFTFVTLDPAYGTEHGKAAFRAYVERQGVAGELVTLIIERMAELNEEIANDPELGRGFRVGHSYFVPTDKEDSRDETWYDTVVDTQIEPLLTEYWFDSQEKVDSALDRLKEGSKSNDGG